MRLLTSLLSVIFGLAAYMLAGMILVGLEVEVSAPVDLLRLVLFVSVAAWLVFSMLDWMYKKVHPSVYISNRGGEPPKPSFTILQAIVSSLRSGVLSLTVPAVALAVCLSVLILPLLVVDSDASSSGQLVIYVAASVLIIGLFGALMQWRYHSNAVGLMMEKSGAAAKKRSRKKEAKSKAIKLQLRIINATKNIRSTKKGLEKQRSASWAQGLSRFRDFTAPLAALLGMIAVSRLAKGEAILGWPLPTVLLVTWGVLMVLARTGSSLRLVDRTPLRELRLGFGFWFHALLIVICAPFVLLFELPGRNGQPHKQWRIIPLLGQWISNLLRSPRLLWYSAIIILCTVPLLGIAEDLDGIAKTPQLALVCIVVSILLFELVYRLFDRLIHGRNGKFNRLVFLRVFGNQRRGQFLFRHVVPRWQGLGSITCIAAPDVSVHQLEPDIGFDILFGRLRQRFLTRDEASVIGRHIRADKLGAVWEDHCFDDAWMSAVQTMLTQNAIVMMDLRGFSPERKGCIYELGVLRDSIPIESVVFLIDDSTDFEFLQNTLMELWKAVASDSPNTSQVGLSANKQRQLTIFRMSTNERASADQLVKLLIEACVSTEEYHRGEGQVLLQQLINDLQLLAADASAQIKAVGGGRQPGKKVLEAGYSVDHDLGSTSYLSSWGLITNEQDDALHAVNEAVQEVRLGGAKQTAGAMDGDPAWSALRYAARSGLKALGKRRSTPKPLRS